MLNVNLTIGYSCKLTLTASDSKLSCLSQGIHVLEKGSIIQRQSEELKRKVSSTSETTEL